MVGMSSQYLLRWNDHLSNYSDVFLSLREEEKFFDCSIACDDGVVGAHRMVLAGCSQYLRDLFVRLDTPHPIIFLVNTPRSLVLLLIEFIYRGEVHIPQNRLEQLVNLGQSLKVKGLTQIQLPSEPSKPPPDTITPMAFPQGLPPISPMMDSIPVVASLREVSHAQNCEGDVGDDELEMNIEEEEGGEGEGEGGGEGEEEGEGGGGEEEENCSTEMDEHDNNDNFDITLTPTKPITTTTTTTTASPMMKIMNTTNPFSNFKTTTTATNLTPTAKPMGNTPMGNTPGFKPKPKTPIRKLNVSGQNPNESPAPSQTPTDMPSQETAKRSSPYTVPSYHNNRSEKIMIGRYALLHGVDAAKKQVTHLYNTQIRTHTINKFIVLHERHNSNDKNDKKKKVESKVKKISS
ncbi:hypothetical protein Pmani_015040 [Petrolisthes manimaculis]|uniref:BTB domain-containing protein n=1 Tax=Petrolisthes manimaculis TaxID=1843537 RepID=A0AAE1PRR6_9EUCA|nr:hypothetical protein Pmani_015040 [Petrolisthes manimaculis]